MKPCGLTYVGWNLLRKKRARVISKNPPTTDYSSVAGLIEELQPGRRQNAGIGEVRSE